MLPLWFGISIAFVYGTIVGSFLNVCIYRLPNEESIVTPPSHCPKCNTKLKGLDLVPLFSFLFLGRKCRYCRAPISWRYFTIELITGLLFVAAYLKFGYTIDFFPYVLFISALIVAFMVDMDCWIIPDQVWIIAAILGLGKDVAHIIAGNAHILHIPVPFTSFRLPMLESIAGFFLCGGLFYLIAVVSDFFLRPRGDEEALKEWEGAMGGGDVKLAAGTGAILGIMPAMVSFFLAVLLGSIVGVSLIIGKIIADKKGVPWRTMIPFGPYMVLGSLSVIFFYSQLGMLWDAWVHLITRT